MSSPPVRRPIRALVIGAGPMSRGTHLPILANLAKEGAVLLSIVCDIQHDRAHAAKERFGFAEHSLDAQAAVERLDIDAVYIFGSAQMHFDYGLSALQRGKHLFVEKPIAPSYTAALQLAEAAQDRQLVAVGGHNRRFF